MPKAKALRYEAAIANNERLLSETAQALNCPAFFRDAGHVIKFLRKTRPRGTHLALHFIAIAVKELLDRHADGAKIALLMAQALAEQKLMNTLMELFCAVFHRNIVCEENQAAGAMKMVKTFTENFDQIMGVIEQGGGEIDLGGGEKAKLIPMSSVFSPLPVNNSGKPVNKKKGGKSLPPSNPWN